MFSVKGHLMLAGIIYTACLFIGTVVGLNPCDNYDCGDKSCDVANEADCTESDPDLCDLICVPAICTRSQLSCNTCPHGYLMKENGCQDDKCGCIEAAVSSDTNAGNQTETTTEQRVEVTTTTMKGDRAMETTTSSQDDGDFDNQTTPTTATTPKQHDGGDLSLSQDTSTIVSTTTATNPSWPCSDVTCPDGYMCVARVLWLPLLSRIGFGVAPGRPWCKEGFRCRRHEIYQYYYCKPIEDSGNLDKSDSSSSSSSDKTNCKRRSCPRFCPEGCKKADNGCPVGQCTRQLCRDRKGNRLCSRNQICKRIAPPRNCYGTDCHWRDRCIDKYKPCRSALEKSKQHKETGTDIKTAFCLVEDIIQNRMALARVLNRFRSAESRSCSSDAECPSDQKCCLGVIQTGWWSRQVHTTCQRTTRKPPNSATLQQYIQRLLRG